MFFVEERLTRHLLQAYQARYPGINGDCVEDAFRMLRCGNLLMHELKMFFTLHDMSSTHFMAMLVIDCRLRKSGIHTNELAACLGVSPSIATEAIKALVRRGLTTRVGTNNDRSAGASLTNHGRASLSRYLPDYFALIESFMKSEAVQHFMVSPRGM